ncbi:MAG: low specificity L-threonine aldolase [Spirochaetales bacterium]|uniref:Low specificity L-threonine aldolase n=1 Tax=Candidatus Thalassospirochaeta sargassi TaxID=3119039 RepID=A0AAJ1MMW9_9SPIO|nr:low specificity L-threonine aldolase [Spirochaetales bacterium]
MKTYDLRSDTITKPTDAMRKAMAAAEVGDDVYFEDPSINKLQEMAAELTGKEAALFVSSGSMGNLISIFLHAGQGREVLCHRDSHIIHHELSSGSALAGAALIGLEGGRGKLNPGALSSAVRPDRYDNCRSGMVELENTINGVYYRRVELKAVSDFAVAAGLPVHMDGARLFNAALASGMTVSEIAAHADSVSFCLSKGLGAPVGSCLCGSKEFIKEARRIRKMLGGGMRQAGILAAAGIYALENNVERLADDHAAASRIAEALSGCSWAELEPADVETNIIFFNTVGRSAGQVVESLAEKGVLGSSDGASTIRLVTSLAVGGGDIDDICSIIEGEA